MLCTFDVSLKAEVQNINEVVVTAMGIKQEKKKIGYTTQQVEGADIAAAGFRREEEKE